MKLLAILLAVALMIGCSGKTDMQQDREYMSQLKEILAQKGIDTTDISAVYDKEKQSIKISQKGNLMTINYEQHFKDLLSENPTSYADRFLISMVVFQEGVTNITSLTFIYEGIKFEVFPFVHETIDEKGIAMAGFSAEEESTRKCFDMLSKISYPLKAYFCTNKGTFELPDEDLVNLMSMTRSYLMDGGKFE